jgi:hypothetical protein
LPRRSTDKKGRPHLGKKGLVESVAASQADIPPEVTKAVVETVVARLSETLASGREISLRGFGRLIPRYYDKSPSKRLGLLFHPSPQLAARCNPAPPEPL